MNCKEQYSPSLKGLVRIFEQENPSNVIFEDHNLILNGTSWLFSRLMFDKSLVNTSVWGLAIGKGYQEWDTNMTDPVPTDNSILQPFPLSLSSPNPLRIPLSAIHYIDSTTNLASSLSATVDFQTSISTISYPVLKGQYIRELGLIGGGVASTDFATANYFNVATPVADSVTLINLKRFQGLQLPDGVNFIISWQLAF